MTIQGEAGRRRNAQQPRPTARLAGQVREPRQNKGALEGPSKGQDWNKLLRNPHKRANRSAGL